MTCGFSDTKEFILFTPGPLTTGQEVKYAMLKDFSPRDEEFVVVIRSVQDRLLRLANCSNDDYAVILIPGSGTYGVESVLSSVVGKHDRILILENGSYGKRFEMIARAHNITYVTEHFNEGQEIDIDAIVNRFAKEQYGHVAMVHCETTTGMLNPIEKIAQLAKKNGARVIVDAMSSFGAIPINIPQFGIDFLISSSNKCIEGVPGFCFVFAKKEELQKAEGNVRSFSLDLIANFRELETHGQFRFTPPAQVIAGFHKALLLLEQEGGIKARMQRYQNNQTLLRRNMEELGFSCYLSSEKQSPIVTSFRYPKHPNFSFKTFYTKLKERGLLIYPDKVTEADCFRIGTIGHIFQNDIGKLTSAIADILREMSLPLPLN
jgi:2-aminoethylphosphonate-pyruvate transaminase